MALREELEREGNWLFRWRSYLPLLTAAIILFALRHPVPCLFNSHPNRLWDFFCLAISLSGLLLRVFTVGSTPKGTSGRNTAGQRADSLNTRGIYSLVRHPLYLSNFFIWFGISLSIRSAWFAIVAILIFWLYYERIMFAEEEFLRQKFGKEFMDWAQKIPAFIPRFGNWTPSKNKIDFKTALAGEYQGFFAIITTFAILGILEAGMKGNFKIDALWAGLFISSLIFYFTVRYLKKKSSFFEKKS